MRNTRNAAHPDWAKLFEHLLAAGVTREEIGTAMGVAITDRMLLAYRSGVAPLRHRQERLVALWRERSGKKRLPMAEGS